MITLKNEELTIDLIDPRDPADQTHLGWRFAHGGLVWQVTDAKVGPLLTGPEWPEPNPSPFNAQGLTESFRHRTRDFKQLYTWRDGVGVAIGCGQIAFDAAGQIVTTKSCAWTVVEHKEQVTFSTHDAFAGFDYALVREARLAGRTLTMISRLTNRAEDPLSLEWFPHPFFEYTDGLIRATLPRPLRMADNPGFTLRDGELALKRRFNGTQDGHMEVVAWPSGVKCLFSVDHPKIHGIENELDGLTPFECVIWGNGNTFSIEPYARIKVAPGETLEFSMRHTFGAVK